MSNDDFIISLNGMYIRNDRSKNDKICLDSRYWYFIEKGKDGYPKMNDDACFNIAGDGNSSSLFKATYIEFYGVKL